MPRNETHRARLCLVFVVVGLSCVLPAIGLPGNHDWAYPLVLLGGVVAITALASFFVFRKRARVERELLVPANLLAQWPSEGGQVAIYKDGVIEDGELYLWSGLETELEGVGRHPRQERTLVFVYRILAGRRLAPSRHTIEVVIPAGADDVADRIIATYGKRLPKDFVRNQLGKRRDEG